ncbi:MAG TPA: cysteine peptidase family C39 domain-containing protein [Blastocatellia bacterium]|jgi:ATP-binding cassette subfamily B protein|nr:cysteine peptidase family C39 domain-containing protein [Blastocatellia bacterium]
MNAFFNQRRFLAPEVVQTSAMDCGPASLKCLLEGFGVLVSYGRLREACQTDVDGTSIDTMEEVAAQLGLDAEQVMVPADHLLLPESGSLPAIAVVRLANGVTHFVVVWRTHGSFVQVMDPGTGRRWMSREQLIRALYIHAATIPAPAWREWVESDSFLNPLRRRLRELGAPKGEIERSIESALGDESWRSMAALDAAARMTAAIVDAGGLSRGGAAARILWQFAERARREIGGEQATIPPYYWSVSPSEPNEEGEERLKARGAVLVQVRGRRAKDGEVKQALSPELVAALDEEPTRPGLDLIRLLRRDGLITPMTLIAALAIAACGLTIESVLFQGLFDLGRKLAPTEQRLGAMAALIAFASALMLLEWPIASNALKMGRRLEIRLRVAFMEKIPRLGDRYFQSRLISDMAERGHSAHSLRQLPSLGARFLRLCFELALTTAGLIWLDPAGAWAAAVVAVIALALPLALQSRLTERDLRIRSHNGALSRFYLDAMLGLAPIRAHGAERSVRLEHESLLVEWMRASYDYLRAVVAGETAQSLIGFSLAAWLLFDHLSRAGASGGVLLMVYWALNLPALGQEIAMLAQQYPSQRNVTLRLLEPLGAPEEGGRGDGATGRRGDEESEKRGETFSLEPSLLPVAPSPRRPVAAGVALEFENVSVRAGGHLILNNFDLRIEAGSHVAIVGPSGAGKSSFVGLLLGWHRAADGRVTVDGETLTSERLARLRRETAWVDPAVQLWNRSFIDNLRYGYADCGFEGLNDAANRPSAIRNPRSAIEMAELRPVLEKLPEGLQARLGEGGGLVSGGEGQRVRFGRALMKADARLVILDEPFRGLDREKRRALLGRAREVWRDATLLCVTHDVGETLDFDRVLVMDGGRIVEDAQAVELASRRDSLYRALLDDEEVVRAEMWASDEWRRLRVEGGRVREEERARLYEFH